MSTPASKPVTKITHKDDHVLGAGACGVVYRGLVEQPGALTALRAGQLVAVKRIPIISSTVGKVAVKKVEQEVALLQSLQHVNIVRYYGTMREEHALSIVMEYAEGGSLHTLYRDFGALAEPIVQSFARQMLDGLAYLHSKNVVHRDIKSMNVLLDKSGHIMLADFGCSVDLSALAEKRFKSMAGSLPWMAPEVLKMTTDEGASYPSDIWSLGCTVWEILAGRMPFSDFDNEFHMMCHIASCEDETELLEPVDTISPEALRFVHRCLRMKPEERPTAAELLADSWLRTEAIATPTAAPPAAPATVSKLHSAVKWWEDTFGAANKTVTPNAFITALDCNNTAPKFLAILLGKESMVTFHNFQHFVQWFGPFEVLKGAMGGSKSKRRGGAPPSGYDGYQGDEDPYGYGDGYHYTFRYPTHVIRLIDSSWFHPTLKKEQCDAAMTRTPPGTYCVRLTSQPEEFPGGFTLSLRGDTQVHHFRITRPQTGWEFVFRNGDQDMSFKSLNELIGYYQSNDIVSQKNNRTYKLVTPFDK
jgi:mitogen-activated protein kinase kinase kinase